MPPTDFDFLTGPWRIANVRNRDGETVEFDGESTGVTKYFGGFVNIDVNHFTPPEPHPAFKGMSLRLLDPATELWSIYWIGGATVTLSDPTVGRFEDGEGKFYGGAGDEQWRFLWTGIDTETPHWEQGMSADGGKTWTLDWSMDFSRTAYV